MTKENTRKKRVKKKDSLRWERVIEHKKAGNSLKNEMAFTESALSAITDVFYAFDLSGKFLRWNKTFREVTGYSDAELHAMKPTDFFSGEDVRHISAAIGRIWKDGTSKQEGNFVLKDGRQVPYEFTGSILRDGLGNIIGFSGTGRDLTERKQAEEELKNAKHTLELSKESFNSIVEKSINGIIVTDLKSTVLYSNSTAKNMLAHGNKDFDDYTFPIPVDGRKLIDIVRAQGGEGMGEVIATPITWLGKQSCLMEIFDLTEVDKAEEEIIKNKKELETQAWGLQKANDAIKSLYKEVETTNKKLHELNQVKTDFISTVSHELRTPLTSMKNMVSNILAGVTGEVGDKLKRYILMMNEDIDRLSRLISNLLDISRIEAGKTELKKSLVDIDALARKTISSLEYQANTKNIELKINSPPDSVDLYVDPDRISQVFINLIGNAVKFTPEGGTIVVTIDDRDKEVLCSVSDTGVGVPKDELEKVFDKFHQVGRVDGPGDKGTGLGLPISRELIKMHNGKIWVESEAGKSSTFFFALPKTDTETVFREYLNNGLTKAKKEGTSLSLMVLTLANFDELKNKAKAKEIIRIFKEIDGIVTKTVSSQVNIVHRHQKGEIPIVILKTGRKEILSLEKKLKKAIKAHEFTLNGKPLKIEANFGIASYPEDGEADHQLINKLDASLKERKTYKPRIMVIDDEVDFAMVLKVRLESANYHVVVCHNGPDALEKLKKDSLPDLIIQDLMMPDVDGHEMYMLLKENQRTAHTPILVLSAKGERADKRLGMEFAPYNYMTKPYEPQQLLAKIKEMLEET